MHDERIGVGLRRRLGAANFDQWHSFDHDAFPPLHAQLLHLDLCPRSLLTARIHTVAGPEQLGGKGDVQASALV